MRSFDDDRWSDGDDEYQVGYSRPPQHSRFKKGHSGNASGKPGAKKHSAFLMRKVLLQLLPVKRNGRRGRFTKLQAFATQLVNKATGGDYQAISLLLSCRFWIHSELTEPSRQQGGLSPEEGEAIRRALLDLPDEDYSVAKEKPSSAEHPPTPATPEVQPQEKEKRTRPSEVGFGRPPVQHRFRKGQSGNPAGRPPVLKTFARLIKRLLLEKVRITENGCPRTVTRLQLIFEQIVNRAALGNARFQRLLLEYIPSVDIALDRNRKPPKNLVQIIRKRLLESMDSDD
jgi:hypothetical protein